MRSATERATDESGEMGRMTTTWQEREGAPSHATHQTTLRATLQTTWRRLAPPARRASLALAGAALDGVSAACRRMPPRARDRLASGIGSLAGALLPWRRATAARNFAVILRCAPGDPQARALAWASMRNFARMALDFLAVRTMRPADVLTLARPVGAEYFTEALRAGRGVIFALPHVGSWDVAAVFAQAYGCRLTVVTESNWVTELVSTSRATHGVTLAPRDRSLRALFRALHANECVVMLSDVVQEDVQTLDVPFFGRPAPFALGPARLSQHTGAPILVIGSVRLSDNTYRVEAQPPLRPDPTLAGEEAVAALTAAVAAGFERIIAQYPAQWYPYRPIWPAHTPSNP
jgi:lauroyl/myristoyl acyltransferase